MKHSYPDKPPRMKIVVLPVSILVWVLVAEIFFRLIIPASRQPWGYYDPSDKIARFEIGQGSGVYTIGKFAQQRGRWRINNVGWNSHIDYFPRTQRSKPLIAVIGDSFIEAFQVNVENSLAAKLGQKLRGRYDVYAFGKSGAPLSQYLQMSRYVNKRFDPDVLIFNVVHNDFDESLLKVQQVPYFLHLVVTDEEIQESRLPSIAIDAKPITKLVFRSAVFRYVWSNLNYGKFWTERIPPEDDKHQTTTKSLQDRALKFSDRKTQIYRAAEYIVRTMKEEAAGRDLVFMIDAPRGDIYNRTLQQSGVRWMNDLLAELCKRYEAHFVDLTAAFLDRYEEDGTMFNSAYDGHWNEEGHRYAAEVLYRELVRGGTVVEARLAP